MEKDPDAVHVSLQDETKAASGSKSRVLLTSVYDTAGVLAFLRTEWAQFEAQKSRWELERVRLEEQVLALQLQNKSMETLAREQDVRMKMLEHALQKERLNKKTTSHESLPSPQEASVLLSALLEETAADFITVNSNTIVNWKDGKKLLNEYLRSAKNSLQKGGDRQAPLKSCSTPPVQLSTPQKVVTQAATFFVNPVRASEDNLANARTPDMIQSPLPGAQNQSNDASGSNSAPTSSDCWGVDKCFVEKLQSDFVKERKSKEKRKVPAQSAPPGQPEGTPIPDTSFKIPHLVDEVSTIVDVVPSGAFMTRTPRSGPISFRQPMLSAVDFPPNIVDTSCMFTRVGGGGDSFKSVAERQLQLWSLKQTLRSHLNAVSAVRFHPSQDYLITTSHDWTVKVWQIEDKMSSRRRTMSELEPQLTFRGHQSEVLSICLIPSSSGFFTGCALGSVIQWNIPDKPIDPYGSFDPSVFRRKYNHHHDVVWGLETHPHGQLVGSCSADGTCKLWTLSGITPVASSDIIHDVPCASKNPVSISFIPLRTNLMAIGYFPTQFGLFDVEILKMVSLSQPSASPDDRINQLKAHPTAQVLVSAHEDCCLRFFDIRTNSESLRIKAHLDGIRCLDIDQSGVYVLSGSHDGCIRIWDWRSEKYVQEFRQHRRIFDCGVLDVAFHPSHPTWASAGADGQCMIFT